MAQMSAKPVRGTRDILPDEMLIRDRLEQQILKIYREHGFSRIETPVLENVDLLLGSDGGENLKMLFTVLKRGEKLQVHEDSTVADLCDMGLRYDLTLPLSRFYSNNANELELPFKAIQIGNVFRAERPQKGRFRSFKQCDIDIIGDSSIAAEIELMSTTAKALMAIGFEGFTIKVNDRQLLTKAIEQAGFKAEDVGSVCISLDKADKIGAEGVKAELVAKGYDEKMVCDFVDRASAVTLDNIQELIDLPEVVEDLKRTISTVRKMADGRYDVDFDFTLIRGMGYYTGQVFEIRYGDVGYSIAGGGRYDQMIGKYSKNTVPAVGFSIGFERIVGILMEKETSMREEDRPVALFYPADADLSDVIALADTYRESGHRINLIARKKKAGKQINACEEKGYLGYLFFGKDENIQYFDGRIAF